MCAGIPRSGSTWLYNAARLLLSRHGGEANVYGAWVDQYDAANAARWHVVKVHEPNEALLWRARAALTSRRDVRDIAASAWKRGWITDEAAAVVLLDDVVRQHAFWKGRCAYEMVYERMRREPSAELQRVAAALQIALGAEEAAEVARQIESLRFDDSRSEPFDPASLLHKQHVMDGRVGYYAQTLPAAVLAAINERYALWLRENEYAARSDDRASQAVL